MNAVSHLRQRMLRLDPPLTRDLVVERDLRVPMSDGVVLLANRWAPKAGGDGRPVALLRSPYILAHDRDDPYWAPPDHRGEVAKVSIPVSSVGGWYDHDPARPSAITLPVRRVGPAH